MELSEAYFCRELNPRELKKLEWVAVLRRFAPGDAIVRVGEDMNDIFLLRDGRVRVTIESDRGGGADAVEEVLARFGPGECIGEFSYADRKPASASIVADDDTSAWRIPHLELDALLESDPELARKVLGAMLRMVVARMRQTAADLVLARYVGRFV